MSVQDLSCWHDRRTVDNAHGRSGYLSFQQFDRATDRAEAPASVTDGAAIPSARQLGSSTDSRSEPEKGRWFGVRWWSYYDSQWASFGLWNISRLILDDVKLLRLDDPAFLEASRTIARRIVLRPRKV